MKRTVSRTYAFVCGHAQTSAPASARPGATTNKLEANLKINREIDIFQARTSIVDPDGNRLTVINK
eukprot:5522229-Pyramimonas_sp.AAC.1